MKYFIDEVFKSLEKNNIKYAVLRNYESLPQKPIDSEYFDLDLIVSSKDYSKYRSVVNEVAVKHNATIVKEFNRSYVRHLRLVKFVENQYLAVQLDAHIKGQGWHGYYYLHEDEILKYRKKYNDIYVISDFHKALINWLDKLLWGGYIKDKYRNDIQSIMKSHVKLLKEFLNNNISKNDTHQLIKIFTNGNLNDSIAYRSKLITGIRLSSIRQHLLPTLLWTVEFYYRELMLRIKPPGLKIIFKENTALSQEIFNELNSIILGESFYLDLNCDNCLSNNPSRKIFTILRKQGLVAIISKKLVDDNSQICLMLSSESNNKNAVVRDILSRYKKKRLFGPTVVYIAN